MNNAELYIQQNYIQTREMRHFLSEFSEKFIKCKNGARVADLGCATGDATVYVLMPKSKNCIRMTGLDLAPELVRFANEKFASTNISFHILDIGTKNLPQEYINAFDQVFSFNCIHWIADKWQVFKNISKMLASNGEMFLNFVLKFPTFKSYVTLSKTSKWHKYLNKIDDFAFETSENGHIKNVLRFWKIMFKMLRFDVRCLESCRRSFCLDSVDALKRFLSAFDPFLDDIPENLQDYYLTDLADVVISLCDVVLDRKNNITKIIYTWDTVVIHAVKI